MQAGIALGSNIEPRLLNLQAAVRRLQELHKGPPQPRYSRIYETSPVDCPPGSPNFLNAVMEIETDLTPDQLLKHLKAIEKELGRPDIRSKNDPRTVDLDLLYCDEHLRDTQEFTLPHPRIVERLFVLQPLADVNPGLQLPGWPDRADKLVERYSGLEKVTVLEGSFLCK